MIRFSTHPGGCRFQIETFVGYILLLGLLGSVTLLLIGMSWRWLETGTLQLDYSLGGMNLFRFMVAEMQLLTHGTISPRIIVSLGITVLLLTPYLRVLSSMLYFAIAEHDIKYTCFSGFVLAVLTYSLFLS
jgi:uncharacterized membrane protein